MRDIVQVIDCGMNAYRKCVAGMFASGYQGSICIIIDVLFILSSIILFRTVINLMNM